jgi:predicted metalloprotease
MRWDDGHDSPDVIDRRGEGPRLGGGGGGLGILFYLLPWLLRTPFGWVVLLVAVGYFVFRSLFAVDPQRAHGGGAASPSKSDPDAQMVHFVGFVLDDVQASWTTQFQQMGKPYRHAKLVLFTDATETACGEGESATGPFYCPNDQRVYIDLGFYAELTQRFHARGQFAQAYVIAHEVGHHVQELLGINDAVNGGRGVTRGATGSSVRMELQADCFAGIWAHSTQQRGLLEAGDIDSALGAATAIGDDRLQRQSTGVVAPEKWTHGSSEERVRWFKRGFEGGRIPDCDTFSAKTL